MREQISSDKANRIRETYEYVDQDEGFTPSDDWKHVYPVGADSKYGTFVYSDKLKMWRGPTMMEFYGGAVVD